MIFYVLSAFIYQCLDRETMISWLMARNSGAVLVQYVQYVRSVESEDTEIQTSA